MRREHLTFEMKVSEKGSVKFACNNPLSEIPSALSERPCGFITAVIRDVIINPSRGGICLTVPDGVQ